MGVGLRPVGTSVVGFDGDDMRVPDELHAFQREFGLSGSLQVAGIGERASRGPGHGAGEGSGGPARRACRLLTSAMPPPPPDTTAQVR